MTKTEFIKIIIYNDVMTAIIFRLSWGIGKQQCPSHLSVQHFDFQLGPAASCHLKVPLPCTSKSSYNSLFWQFLLRTCYVIQKSDQDNAKNYKPVDLLLVTLILRAFPGTDSRSFISFEEVLKTLERL